MKTVFNNSEFFHQWARRVLPADAQDRIRTSGGSLSAYNRVLYSYDTAIARIVDTGTRHVVLITSNSYSPTTTRHLSEARSAVRHMTVYSAPFVGLPGGWNGNDSHDMNNVHAGNMAYFKAEHDKMVGKLRRARYVNGSCADILAVNASVAITYAADFGITIPWRFTDAVQAEGDAIDKYRAEREARSNTPEAIAKRAKLAATRGEREERKAARDEQERMAKVAAWVANWRAGANAYTGLYYRNLPPMIRPVAPANGEPYPYFETSHGARVPYAAGIAALKFIVAELDTLSPGNEMKIYNGVLIGDFQLISISTASVQIGCHFFEHAEIRRAHEEYCK